MTNCWLYLTQFVRGLRLKPVVCTQATVEAWLTNSSRFCVPLSAADWPPRNFPPPAIVNKTCYW